MLERRLNIIANVAMFLERLKEQKSKNHTASEEKKPNILSQVLKEVMSLKP
jgi:hypothetical protein